MIARRILIEGHVQGVFFREWTVTKAREIGVTGWVRNLRGGGVEVYAAGDEVAVARLVKALHEGSPASRVDRVDVQEAALKALNGFTRRQTS